MHPDGSARGLTAEQLSELRWLLPETRPGYDRMFRIIDGLSVIGQGRWGENDYILGAPESGVDLSGPMAPVFAHGVIAFTDARRTIIVHDEDDGQVEVQFETQPTDGPSPARSETGRYSYSEWLPGMASPELSASVREIRIPSATTPPACTLALCPAERKLWLHDAVSGVNRLIPHTGFYNELMRCIGERRSDVALAPKLLFDEDARFSDTDLVGALYAYNAGRRLLPLPPFVARQVAKVSFFNRLFGT